MMGKNKRAKILRGQFFLWPDEKGLLIIPAVIIIKPSARISSRSTLLRRVQLGKTSRVMSWLSSTTWRSLSARIEYSFSKATDIYFVTWLTALLREADYGAVRIVSMYAIAERDLGLTGETVKRLLIKHSAPGAEFFADGEILTLAEGV